MGKVRERGQFDCRGRRLCRGRRRCLREIDCRGDSARHRSECQRLKFSRELLLSDRTKASSCFLATFKVAAGVNRVKEVNPGVNRVKEGSEVFFHLQRQGWMDDTASVMQNLSQYTLANTKHIWKTRLVVNLSKSGLKKGGLVNIGAV